MKVNVSKIRKDHNPIEDVDIPLGPAGLVTTSGTVLTVEANVTSPSPVPTTDEK